jgi:hypothetical protein
MEYFEAKRDLAFIREFDAMVEQLWALEDEARKNIDTGLLPRQVAHKVERARAEAIQGYGPVSKNLLRARRTADRLGVPITVRSFPAPAVGGAIFDVNLFQAILTDLSDRGIDRAQIQDAIIQTVGACEERFERERRYLRNPVNWIKEALTFVLRLPFLIIKTTGFDVSKIEDQLWAKVFKLLFLAALVYFAIRFGLTKTLLPEILRSAFR